MNPKISAEVALKRSQLNDGTTHPLTGAPYHIGAFVVDNKDSRLESLSQLGGPFSRLQEATFGIPLASGQGIYAEEAVAVIIVMREEDEEDGDYTKSLGGVVVLLTVNEKHIVSTVHVGNPDTVPADFLWERVHVAMHDAALHLVGEYNKVLEQASTTTYWAS